MPTEFECILDALRDSDVSAAFHEIVAAHFAAIAALEAERDALRKDAARYLAWRAAVCNEDSAFLDAAEKYVVDTGVEPPTSEIMDSAIDAAIAAKGD